MEKMLKAKSDSETPMKKTKGETVVQKMKAETGEDE